MAGQLLPSYQTIAGAWVLDLNRSDTMEGYLNCLGTPNVVIQAQIAGEQAQESRNVIALDESAMVMHKRTRVNNFTETYELGEEKFTPTRLGGRRSTAALRNWGRLDGFMITSTFTSEAGDVMAVETRQLLNQGLAHFQEITLTNVTTGDHHVTRRLWVRVPMTELDSAELQG